MNERCSYCGRPLRSKYGLSYGVPGMPRVFKCDRWWCTPLRVRLNWKWYDLWMFFFWNRHTKVLYFCPLPTIVFSFWWGRKDRCTGSPAARPTGGE